MLWAYGSYVGGRLLVLGSVAILARLLSPEDFGVVSLALIFTGLMQTVKDLGVSQALIVASDEEVRDRADTAFGFSVAMGLLLTGVCAALGPAAASFFDEPELIAVLPVLGATFFVRALGSTHYALAQRAIDFRARTVAEMADVLVRGASGIALALAGAGAWSIVLGYVAGSAAMSAALWVMVDFRPRLRRYTHLRDLLRFGGALTGIDAVSAMLSLIDSIFVGRVLGAAALGLYTLGFRLPELLILNLSIVAGQVLYPAFASIGRERLGDAFLMSLRYTLLIALPMTVILATLAEPLTLLFFGDQWTGSIDVMRVLAIYAMAATIGIPAGTAYKATGRAGVLLALAIPRAVLVVASIAIFIDDGIVAVAACQASVALLFDLFGMVIACRLLDVAPRAVLRAAWPPLAAAAGMLAVCAGLTLALDAEWYAILVAGGAAALTYLALLWFLARDSVEHLRDLAFSRRRALARAPDA
jgi:PST family polysaccharide transporter